MTNHLTWDDFDPIADEPTTAPSEPGSMADALTDPRLVALRDGTVAPTDVSAARRRRLGVLEQEHREYARVIDELDRLIAHLGTCPNISTPVMGVALAHLADRRARVLASWTKIGADLDTLRRAS